MKTLTKYLSEKLIINKNYKQAYSYVPTTWDELRQIIEERYKKQGPGTEENPINFNDIDVSRMTTFYNKKEDIGIFQKIDFEYIDISDWDVSNVKDMRWMFGHCKSLKSVGDLSNWDVSEDKNTTWMFTRSGVTNRPSWYKE